ncbi:MAG: hypothetical protein QOE70_679 [Chthoniobacter sp.]|jgi:hypothetical protein|nr:hypothetical protein [Chthoniobacter sp.]
MNSSTLRPPLVCGILLVFLLAAAENPQPAAKADATPHIHNHALKSEHAAMLALIAGSDVTHEAIRAGLWSNPGTWKDGRLPQNEAVVLIPAGTTVVLDRVEAARLRGLRVDGRVQFAADRDTALRVETIVVTPGGELEIGTPARPIAAGATARVTFLDRGPIDLGRDPRQFSRGLIAHGAVTICGAVTTPFGALARPAKAGDTRLVLTERPTHWKVGDRLLLPGTRAGRGEDEELSIVNVNGAEITVAPIEHDHLPPAGDIPTWLANLSRNVIFESENAAALDRLGHVMFMHTPKVSLAFAAFEHLGRTNKLKPIDDPRFDEEGKLVGGTGGNPRGRYAVHFHRTGTEAGDPPARVQGCVVTHGPGWGFVNHSSNVEFDGNVAFDVAGSAFVTEAGDEIGAFRGNLAVRSQGSGEDEDARRRVQDFGHEGDGFWFQGGGVIVEDNIAAGQAGSGFIFFTLGLEQEGLGRMRFAVANLWDMTWAAKVERVDHKDPEKINDPDSVPVIAVPIRSFKRNVALACENGLTSRFLQPQAARSAYEDSLVWNCRRGVHVRYTSNFDLRNLRLVGDPQDKSARAAIFGTNEGEQHIRYQNLRVEGWPAGLVIPQAGHHVIECGFYNNARSIVIPTPLQRGRRVEITGEVKFGTLDPAKGAPQFDIYMDATYAGLLQGGSGYRDPNVLFATDVTTMQTPGQAGRQLFYLEQAPEAVPFPREQDPKTMKQIGRIEGNLPGELIGRTTREMWQRYGVAIAGAVAPADAAREPRLHGLSGRPVAYPDELRPREVRIESASVFQFAYIGDRQKQPVVDPTPAALRDGWNLVTSTVRGAPRSFLIFAGALKPAGKKLGK